MRGRVDEGKKEKFAVINKNFRSFFLPLLPSCPLALLPSCPRGQALVEVALVFPIFLLIAFGVMQLGHLAAMAIVVNHATFEVARIGAITSLGFSPGREVSCSSARLDLEKMVNVARQIFDPFPGELDEPIQWQKVRTLSDPEVRRPNCDLVVTLRYRMPLIFPFINLILAQPPYGGYDQDIGMYRWVVGESRMPLEVPIWY